VRRFVDAGQHDLALRGRRDLQRSGVPHRGSHHRSSADVSSRPNVIALWDFCNAAEIFSRRHIGELILCSDVTQLPHSGNAWGRANMSIETVLLIVILTFGLGFVLNRWELGRGRFRRGSLRGGVWGRRRA
jgi:hypothetical protein